MLPAPRLLKHHQYFIHETSTELEHSVRTHLRDLQEYHLRLAALHHVYLHGWGVVDGLDVGISTEDAQALTVQPGIAVDRAGAVIVLSADGNDRAFVGATQEELTPPYVVSTRDLAPDDTYYLTIRVTTELNNADQIEFLPWLQFSPAATSTSEITDGIELILALFTLDSNGNITTLQSENSAFVHRRHMLFTQGVESLQIRQSIVADDVVQNRGIASLQSSASGELRVTVSEASSGIAFERADGGQFGRLAVRADEVTLSGSIGIGTDAPASGLHVTGDVLADAGLQVNGPTVLAGGAEASRLRVMGTAEANTLRVTGHSEASSLAIAGTVEAGRLQVTGNSDLAGDLAVTGTVNGRDIGTDGTRLDAHVANRANPHQVTTTQIGALAISGGQITGSLRVSGRVGIGANSPVEKLDVNGRIKARNLTIGAWPANGSFAFVGTNALNQRASGNYALLQDGAGSDAGRTFLNSPKQIHFRINNKDCMFLAGNGRVGIGRTNPQVKLHVRGNRIRLTKTSNSRHFVDLRADGSALDLESRGADLFINNHGKTKTRIRNFVSISSRAYKVDIAPLSATEATQLLQDLSPVKYHQKDDEMNEDHIGFIAEEVPRVFATSDRKAYKPTDVIAVLTKVVQEQQAMIQRLIQ